MKLIVGILLLFSPFLSQAQGVFDFKTKEIELKNLKADETPTTVTFGFKNTGTQPIIISRVAPVTTLVKATWNEQPVAPGIRSKSLFPRHRYPRISIIRLRSTPTHHRRGNN